MLIQFRNQLLLLAVCVVATIINAVGVAGNALGQDTRAIFESSHQERMALDPVYAATIEAFEQELGHTETRNETRVIERCVYERVMVRGRFRLRPRVILVPRIVAEEEVIAATVVVPYEFAMQRESDESPADETIQEVDYRPLPDPVIAISSRIREILDNLRPGELAIRVLPRAASVAPEADRVILAVADGDSTPISREVPDAEFSAAFAGYRLEYTINCLIDQVEDDRMVYIQVFTEGFDGNGDRIGRGDKSTLSRNLAELIKDELGRGNPSSSVTP